MRILILDGHPDPDTARYGHALAGAYGTGARDGAHETRMIRLADVIVSPLTSAAKFAAPPDDPAILSARADMEWAEHLVIVAPLWLGSMPSKLRAFFEHIARAGFVADVSATGWRPRLKGKTARLIVTMGMPAFAYRLFFGAHGVKAWERSILGFAGIGPVRETLLGMIESVSPAERARRIERVRALGRAGR